MKPRISLPTLLTYMLSSRGCSHGDELVHRSTGCRNWAITLRHLNTFHYFPHTREWWPRTHNRQKHKLWHYRRFVCQYTSSFLLKKSPCLTLQCSISVYKQKTHGVPPWTRPAPCRLKRSSQLLPLKWVRVLAGCSLTGWTSQADGMVLSPTS